MVKEISREKMQTHTGIVKFGFILILMAGMTAVSGDPLTFRQGENGYMGCEDATIVDDGWSCPATRLRVNGEYPGGDEEYNVLIRFDDISAGLQGLTVTDASLTLTFQEEDPEWAPATLDIYTCLVDWDNPSWFKAIPPDISWDTYGAQGVGTDRGSFQRDYYMGPRHFNDIQYPDDSPFEISLPTTLVQSWIDDPNSNHGLIIVMNPGAATDVTFSSSEDATTDFRPLLTITVGVTVEVPNVIGKLYDTAVGIISNAGLTVGDVRYEYNEEDPCYVFEQDPCSGSLGAGESIDLWVSRGPQPTPDYNGDYVVDKLDLLLLADEWLDCEDVTTDLTDDGCIDMSDFAVFAAAWMEVTIVADISGNGCVGIEDLEVMARQWLTCEETNTADLFDGQDGGCVNMLDFAIMSQQWGLGLCDGP